MDGHDNELAMKYNDSQTCLEDHLLLKKSPLQTPKCVFLAAIHLYWRDHQSCLERPQCFSFLSILMK